MSEQQHKQALPLGYDLNGYRMVSVLGVGGFGVTYLAEHVRLGHRVAIKEYLPNEFAVREGTAVHAKSEADRDALEWGLDRFMDEAKTLARFEHRNLVRVRDYFESNATAYIVMDYEEGESLDRLLKRHGTLTESQLRRVLLPIVDGLREVHVAGFLHRDIKPSNVYVRRSDESPVLLDFGAARQALGRKSRSLTAVASAGYSPPEQYTSAAEQGPYTEIYALSALCYKAITGKAPVEAPERQSCLLRNQTDPLPQLRQEAPAGYSKEFLAAVDWGLRVIETQRPGSLDEWMAALEGAATPEPDGTPTGIVARSRPSGVSKSGGARSWVWAGALTLGVTAMAVAAWWIVTNPGGDAVSGAGVATSVVENPVPSDAAPNVPAVQPGAVPLDSTANEASAEEASGRSVLGSGNAIVVVATEPPGAQVLIGGELAGETPLELSQVRSGSYDMVLDHPDYETVELAGQTFADERVLRIDQVLVPATGSLTVRTQPRETWVELGGRRLADGTPVTLDELPAGTVELTLGAEAYRSVSVTAEVPRDGVGRLEWTLEPIPYGTLTVEVDPTDAIVTLPDIGPAYEPGMSLLEGEYRVTVSREGYESATRSFEVSGDTRERIVLVEVVPEPFTVQVTPPGAHVELIGRGEAYVPGMPLEPGEYRVRASAEEYESVEVSLAHGGEPTVYSINLVRRPQPFTVLTDPDWAAVELLGSGASYETGMRLTPGEYHIRMSADGFESVQMAVDHGTEPTSQTVALTLLEKCEEDSAGSYCWTDWMELVNHPGCYLWNPQWLTRRSTASRWSESVSWSGECSGGFAEGTGTVTLRVSYSDYVSGSEHDITHTRTGSVQGGKQNGQWVENLRSTSNEETTLVIQSKGPYLDGKRHGHWVENLRFQTFNREDGNETVSVSQHEGPYVQGYPKVVSDGTRL